MPPEPLKADQVYRRCPPEQFDFASTDELRDPGQVVGQDRAVEALEFALNVRQEGFNLYVLGPPASGRHTIVKQYLNALAANQPQPDDWVYVHNFETPHRPRALRLPAGRASKLHADMVRFVEEVSAALPAVFETDEYRTRREAIDTEFKEHQEKAFGEIGDEAQKRDLALIRTPAGLALAPVRGDEVMPPDEFRKLPQAVREKIEKDIEELQNRLQEIVQKVPDWDRERRRQLRELNREVTQLTVSRLIEHLKQDYAGIEGVLTHLDAVQKDVIDNADTFLAAAHAERGEGPGGGPMGALGPMLQAMQGQRSDGGAQALYRRYQINVIVGDDGSTAAPVVAEDSPNYNNLIGRIEHMAEMGALFTDFMLIKPGALHRANGGYLVLDTLRLLQQPFAYEALKRALRSNAITIESPGQMLSMVSTISLEPEPIPLSTKVVLIGDRQLYYMLCRLDPDFNELFKVSAEFEEDLPANGDCIHQYARMVAQAARKRRTRPLDPGGIARVVEHSQRMAGDVDKLSLQIGHVSDLLTEADYWAGRNDAKLIGAREVQQALDAQIRRRDRIARRLQEAIERDLILVDTSGAKVGQINGLAVLDLGNFMFGKPSRITARIRLGAGEVIDIERRAELGGPTHSKGVLILSGYLGARFPGDHPLSLSASLVFEQSYGGVDGDSASSAELYALLSALSGLPIKQNFAVTGSVNQYGQVQAIGGVNEKVEGFFDLCKARGLTGEQGVLIPVSNVRHLMLRPDVVEAIRDGKFAVYPITTIDEGIELLTGTPAGEPDSEGNYPEGTVNRRVRDRLMELAEVRRKFGQPLRGTPGAGGDGNDDKDKH